MPKRAVVLNRIAVVTIGTLVVLLALPFVHLWDYEEGRTMCYPLIGPIERFAPDLSRAALARVRAHEDAHAAQCRRDGAVWQFFRRLTTRGRLAAESEAYCAEAASAVAAGGSARIEYARVQDELREAVWFHRLSDETLTAALAAQCPRLAEQAEHEQAAWEARRPHAHGS